MRDSYALYSDQLQGEYKEAFAQVEAYVNTQNVDEDTVESHLGELLDTFLNAQEEGKPVEKIVGDDMESFCKNFCSEFTWENKAMNFVERWKSLAWVILAIEGLDVLFLIFSALSAGDSVGEVLMTKSTFNLTGYIIGIMIAWGIYMILDYVTQKIMFKLEKGSFAVKAWKVVKVLTSIGGFFIIFMMLENEKLNFLALPSWVLATAAGLFLVVYYIMNRERVKERKENKISFWGMVQEQVDSDIPSEFAKEMQKQFEKKNRKLLKKGKPAMTWEEYLDYQEKECDRCDKLKVLFDWTPVVLALGFGLIEYITSGFSLDLIIFVVILFIVEFFVMRGLWKVEKSAVKTKRDWIATERQRMEETEL